jgi:hypothetical protein
MQTIDEKGRCAMLECISIKKKLYEYVDDTLSEADKERIRVHLEACSSCSRRVEQMRIVIGLAENKQVSYPQDEFWHKFGTELDAKLNDKLVAPFESKPAIGFKLRPALLVPVLSVVIVALGLSFFYRMSGTENSLVNDIALLEEMGPEAIFMSPEEAYFDDAGLFE